jgi:hypothetical protein
MSAFTESNTVEQMIIDAVTTAFKKTLPNVREDSEPGWGGSRARLSHFLDQNANSCGIWPF